MSRAALSLSLVGFLGAQVLAQTSPVSSTEALAIGIRQLDEGDVEAALITFDSVVRRMETSRAPSSDLAMARAYLGLTYLQLNQLDKAVAEIRRACRADPELQLDSERFPPTLLRLLEEFRAEISAEARAPAPSPAPAAENVPSAPESRRTEQKPEKSGSKLLPIALGAGGAAGLAVVLGGGGGDGSASASEDPPAPVDEWVAAAATISEPLDEGYVCFLPPCNPATTDYATARAAFDFTPVPQGQRLQGTLGIDVYLEMNSPTRLRASSRDGCAPNAELAIELLEPNGARHVFAERPFITRSDPIHTVHTTVQWSQPLDLTGPFASGGWNLTLTWKHYPNGSYTTCLGLLRLNTTNLQVLVRR